MALKKEQPLRSDKAINRILKREFGRQVPRSTLYRHLRQQGATRRKLGVSKEKVRCRWTRDQPGALWVGDFEHGPPVIHQGQSVKTHLSAWIDCHSRYIVEARYYVRENLDILRGFAAAGLGKARRQPRTVRGQRQDLPRQGPATGLHPAQHPALAPAATRSSGRRPDRTLLPDLPDAVGSGGPRRKDPHAGRLEPRLGGLARRWPITRRCIAKPARRPTSVTTRSPGSCGRSIWAPCWASFISACRASSTRTSPTCAWRACSSPSIRSSAAIAVIVQYDPFSPLQEVQLYTPAGVYLGRGRRYQREKGSHPQPPPAPPAGPITPHYLDALRAEHAALQEQRRSLGIDYHSARQRNVWSLSSFARVFARLLGRQGGVSGLTAQEMDLLAAFHARHDRVTESLLRQAFEQAPAATLPEVLFQLQSLLSRKERLMYLEHLQLKSQPFAEHAAVAALWQDQRMDEGLARLEYLVQCGQLGLITGPSGVGKSALLKRFLHGLLPQHCQALYCHLSHLPFGGPVETGRHATGRDATPRQRTHLRTDPGTRPRGPRAPCCWSSTRPTCLDGDALTDLRLLISSALDVRPPLKLLLVGQEPLRAVLRRAQHADLVNRISVRYQLRPLTREQTCRYIDFQLTQAGGDPKLFDDSVKAAIHDFANGVPRQINNLATACLLQATARKVRRIDDELFQQVLGEFQLP